MNTIDITEHHLDLADLENILIHQKIKPLRINYWNRGETLNDLGYLALDIKIHRYSFTLFTGDFDYEQFYPILERSRNLNKLNVILKGGVE
jgi:hypothetical protein